MKPFGVFIFGLMLSACGSAGSLATSLARSFSTAPSASKQSKIVFVMP
jgi:hypothetical protein